MTSLRRQPATQKKFPHPLIQSHHLRRSTTVNLLPVAAEQLLEGASEVVVEERIEDGVDGRIGVAEPEEEGLKLARHDAQRRRAPAAHDVDDEEAQPHPAEESDDDRHPYGGPHLALVLTTPKLPPLLLTMRFLMMRQYPGNRRQRHERSR